MDVVWDLISSIFLCVERIWETKNDFYLILSIAITSSVILWLFASQYTKLWNKKYTAKPIHYILFSLASVFTFVFVFVYYGMKFLQDVSNAEIISWSISLNQNDEWADQVFKKAYDRIEEMGLEDFDDYPFSKRRIPSARQETILEISDLYAKAVYQNFRENHPFLKRIIWANTEAPLEKIQASMDNFFKNNPGESYDLSKAINIASDIFRDQLREQTPRVVFVSRVILIILFVFFQLIAFGSVGVAAYQDIKIHT